MKLKILAFVAVMAMSVSGSGKASFYKGSGILSDCESKSDQNKTYCIMYLAGIADTHQTLNSVEILVAKYFCMPENVSMGQLRKVFIKYANDNPQRLHQSATSLAMDAFGEAFPCK